jgi:polyisoprenoid-binding protein YceI
VLAGEKAVTRVQVNVPARQLDCANGTMNSHMLKALKADAHPEIVFRLSGYELGRGADGVRVDMSGTLTLGGVQRPVVITGVAGESAPGVLRVVGTHEIRMTEFDLKPPTLMMGTMRVNERITVRFDLSLKA